MSHGVTGHDLNDVIDHRTRENRSALNNLAAPDNVTNHAVYHIHLDNLKYRHFFLKHLVIYNASQQHNAVQCIEHSVIPN
jgi:hypothetical protein